MHGGQGPFDEPLIGSVPPYYGQIGLFYINAPALRSAPSDGRAVHAKQEDTRGRAVQTVQGMKGCTCLQDCRIKSSHCILYERAAVNTYTRGLVHREKMGITVEYIHTGC